MKLALLTFYPRDIEVVPGGIRMVSLNLVRGLLERPDLDLTVIHCHSDIEADATVRQGAAEVRYLAMPRQRLVPNLITSLGRIVEVLGEVRPDLVHAHTAHFAYASLRAGLPTILTIHGVLSEQRRVYNRTLYDRARYGMLACYEWRALPRVAAVTAISSYVVEAYRAQGSSAWRRIDNPVPDEFFALADAPEPGRILYAGSTDARKDLITLLRAVDCLRRELPNVLLAIAGHVTDPAYERQVHRLVEERGLESHVAFLGLLSRDQLLREYARCSVVALASVEENAPMALIEGMAAGNPVVATRVGGIPDLVAHGETGFMVPARDPAAMADKLGRLLRDPGLRLRMGREARARARQRYGLSAIAESYHALYLDTLGGL